MSRPKADRVGRPDVVLFLAALSASSVACVTSKRDDVINAGKAAVVAEPKANADAAGRVEASSREGGVLAPPPSEPVTALSAVVEGACARATPFAVGTSPVLVVKRDAWIMGADVPRALHRMGGPSYDRLSGTMHTDDHVGLVGGIDEAHAWVQVRTSSGRGEDTSALWFHFPEWHFVKTPHGEAGLYGITHVIPQADGGFWAYGQHSMYLDIPGDTRDGEANHNRYFAWSATGEPLTMNLPGGDMVNAVRMASGELVAVGLSKQGEAQLRRWSPTKKVDDLVLKGAVAPLGTDPALGVGTTRAVLLPVKQKHVFYTYYGETLQPSALNARLKDVGSWLVTSSDDLMVATADGTLFIETKDGAVTEEKLPEPGRLAGEPTVPWLMANSGALYRRAGAEWKKLTLPESPWAAETHPAARVEWVKVVAGETWVSTVRTDVGFGLRKPGEVRVLYSSKARPAPIRCGAPFGSEATMAPFPPRATASCDKLVVVVAAEKEREQPPSYPKVGAALKGDAAVGDTLSVVGFGPEDTPVLGIEAKTSEIAAELVKKLARVAPHAPEIVCGASDVRRRLELDVKTGVFSTRR